jgi:hypothetical protein
MKNSVSDYIRWSRADNERNATSNNFGMVSAWKKGRPRNSWMQEVKTGMREKGINSMEVWKIDREVWKRKEN